MFLIYDSYNWRSKVWTSHEVKRFKKSKHLKVKNGRSDMTLGWGWGFFLGGRGGMRAGSGWAYAIQDGIEIGGENSSTGPTMLVIWGKSHLGNDLSIIRYSLNYPALSGNRTPVSRVAGENSTTEPTMLKQSITIHLLGTITLGSNEQCLKCVKWPRWGSNPQSSDSKSDALSIGPRGRWYIVNI